MRFEVSQGIRLRITLESLQHLRIAQQFFRQELQSHLTAKPQILSF